MPYDHLCRRCGALYEATRSDSTWCSHACRAAARRERIDVDAALGAAALDGLEAAISASLDTATTESDYA